MSIFDIQETFQDRKRLYARTIPTLPERQWFPPNKNLFAGTIPPNKDLFARSPLVVSLYVFLLLTKN